MYTLCSFLGIKEERHAIQCLWNTWRQKVRLYTLNQFAGALQDGEHLLSTDKTKNAYIIVS
jgi:hypothetical protein